MTDLTLIRPQYDRIVQGRLGHVEDFQQIPRFKKSVTLLLPSTTS